MLGMQKELGHRNLKDESMYAKKKRVNEIVFSGPSTGIFPLG